jgi:glyoxylase-like metal-dependent hydrolase (beta-lactamase superfamily II)
MELYKGVHQISSLYGGRYLFQYLFVGDRVVLVDSGIAETPEKVIFPHMEQLGINPEQLAMLITTHPDMDHQGGNSAVRMKAPRALTACGESDRQMVQDPKCLYRDRYNHLHKDHGIGSKTEPSPDAGDRCRIDVGFRGGERVIIRDGQELEVLHVPGHSSGHLALFDRVRGAAFVSDAVHGRGCPKADGSMALPVTYFYVDLYLSTLAQLEGLEIQELHTGHWPSMYGDEIKDFLSDSRRTVEITDRRILLAIAKARSGLTLNQLIDEAREEFPNWPTSTRDAAMFPINGHLERLEKSGQIRAIPDSLPKRWKSL